MPPAADLSAFMTHGATSHRVHHHGPKEPAHAPSAASHLSEVKQGPGKAEDFRAMAKEAVLLRKLPPEAQAFIHRSCKLVKKKEGQVVYSEGDLADVVFMIESGRFQATKTAGNGLDQQKMREYTDGETFGTHSLLSGALRSETVTAVETGRLWVLPKKRAHIVCFCSAL